MSDNEISRINAQIKKMQRDIDLLRAALADPREVKTLGEQPFGTSHWAGTWRNLPAISLSYYNGATLFYFDHDHKWKKSKFSNLAELHDFLGIN